MTRPSGTSASLSSGPVSAIHARPVASSTAPSRFDSCSSGEKTRKFAVASFSFTTSRSHTPRVRVASPVVAPGLATSAAYSRKSGRRSGRRIVPPFACGVALIRLSAAGCRSRISGTGAPRSSKSSSGR